MMVKCTHGWFGFRRIDHAAAMQKIERHLLDPRTRSGLAINVPQSSEPAALPAQLDTHWHDVFIIDG